MLMPRSAWEWTLLAVVLGFPWFIARGGRRRDLTACIFVLNALAACSLVLANPSGDSLTTTLVAIGLGGLDLGACFAPESFENGLRRLLRHRSIAAALVLLIVTVLPLGTLEFACRFLTWAQILQYHQPIQTVWRAGADDWRVATITGDENREPDPVLLWRPVAHKPFNSQRFKGPLAAVPKPGNVVRIMCYGDSLTDGPPKGGWPTWLNELWKQSPPLSGRRVEVLNAGVAGYSSHQGVLRFLQEADHYRPDLVLVSFGWNDAAEAIGQPDRSFRVPPWALVACQRALIRYRAYLVVMHYTQRWRSPPAPSTSKAGHPRVSIDDYLANLDRFRAEAQARGIAIIFLTRPHKMPVAELRSHPTWRHSVPDYNAALVEWSQERGASLIDVQRHFESLPDEVFSDECHFTPTGYQLMAELIRDHVAAGADGSLGVRPTTAGMARSGQDPRGSLR
jgi:lysophospholipase L1-like esterase